MLAGAIEGSVPVTAEPAGSCPLAIKGGPKAVKKGPPSLPTRWGQPERERLDAMLQQGSLFYWKGPQTTLMLECFRKICPVKHAMTVSTGTAALHVAVAAAGIGPGDEVITSPITDVGTVIGVIYQQGVPVFAEFGASTYNLDVADVQRRITPRPRRSSPCTSAAIPAT